MTTEQKNLSAYKAAPNHHFDSVARAFDDIAATFDSNLENEITARLRKRLYATIEALVPPGSAVLDVNCGTGIDATYLADKGYDVHGIDISPKMVSITQAKLKRGDHLNANVQVCSFDLVSPSIVPTCDLVYSNFGGLNCTARLESAANAVASVTKPGGYFVGVIMPPFSIWETVSFVFRRQWSAAFRRMRGPASATGFPLNTFPVYYYSARKAIRIFSRFFVPKQIIGLSVLSPTPQSILFVRRYPRLSKFLVMLDTLIERVPLLRSCGDHYILVLQRNR